MDPKKNTGCKEKQPVEKPKPVQKPEPGKKPDVKQPAKPVNPQKR